MTLILASLPVVFPLALVIAGLIRIVSSGPVLFKQERVGYLGRRFMCFKFRTMVVNADNAVHQEHLNHLMSSKRSDGENGRARRSAGDSLRARCSGCPAWTSCHRSSMCFAVK
jgi:lipopolysaccharide/colanic/teichoic acid biosynthesis glycosyltransferase